MSASSSGDGGRIAWRLDVFDIVLHLMARRATQTDDPADLAAFGKGYVILGLGLGCESDHAHLVIYKAIICPDQRGIPIKLGCQ